MHPESDKTNLWVLNAMVAGIAVLVAALAGFVFVVTRSGWAIVAFIVIEGGLFILHFVLRDRILRG